VSVDEIAKRVERLRKQAADRELRIRAATQVINGRAHEVFRGHFPEEWPRAIVANTVRSAMEDTASMVGVLPTLSAASDTALDESKRSRAGKLSRIVNAIAYQSDLGGQLVTGAARLAVAGFVPVRVEPLFDEGRPHVHVDDPAGCYYERDRFRRVLSYSRVHRIRASELAALWPEHESRILSMDWMSRTREQDEWLDVVQWTDADQVLMFVPKRENLVLSRVENRLGRVPVRIAQMPTLDGSAQGEYDEALWVFAAKAKLALLNLEAASKAVQAPLAVPQDVETFEFGPDALIRTSQPRDVQRVRLDIPNSSMFEVGQLDNELKLATHFPDVRAGQTDASVVTGRGVQALMGGYDARVKTAQSMLGSAVADIMGDALEVDRVYFGGTRKKVYASVNGSSYEVEYTPEKDIYSTHVAAEYGVMAGLDPNRALVWALQALGAGLVSEAFVRANIPVNINPGEEERQIDLERLRTAVMTSIQSTAQAIPQMVTQGQDPMAIVTAMVEIIEARKKGIPIEEAAAKAFAPKPPSEEEQAAMQAQADQMAAMAGGGGMPGMPQPGGMPGAGQAPEMPYQPPAMSQLLTQLNGDGTPRTSVRQVRQSII
jgi:hypothetical protein